MVLENEIMKNLLFIVIWSALFMCLNITAQTSQKKESVKQCVPLLAGQIVEQQAAESKTIEETDKRIEVLARIADFLWTQNEPAARGYFAEAYQIAQYRFREKEVERTNEKKFVLLKPDYRFKVINAIIKRDSAWAKKLSDDILKEFDEKQEKDSSGANDALSESEVEKILNVAAGNAKDNPQLALSLVRRVMRYPLTASWYFNLYKMAGENQQLADAVYAELLNSHADAEVYRLLFLSAYPFSRDRIFGIEKHSLGMDVPANFSPNSQLKGQFLNTLFRRVLTLTPENTSESLHTHTPETAVALLAMNEIEPLVARQFPNLLQVASQAKIHAISITSNDILSKANKRDEFGKNFSKSFDAKLKDVEDADKEGKLTDGQIVSLITSAKTEKEFVAAETWLDKIRESGTREGAENYFYFQRSKLALKENRFAEAKRYAERVSTIQHRAILLLAIAESRLIEIASQQEMYEVLLEVDKIANKSPDSVEKAQVYLALASQYAKFDHYSAYNSLSDAIRTANKLDNPNLFATTQSQEIIGKKFSHSIVFEVPGFDMNKVFYQISQKDFQGALLQAGNFSDKYYTALATLAVVKDCKESGKPKKKN